MRFFIAALLMLPALVILAQPKQNSPYSRFGIGDLEPTYFANQAGYGGQTAAFHDPFHLNPANPASYAHLRTTTLETGLYSKFSHYTSGSSTLDNWSGNLGYLALGFTLKSPINEVLDKTKSPWKFGMGVTLSPVSQVGYNVETDSTSIALGTVTSSYEGNGGIYKLGWATAAKYKNTSMGLSLGWMFGKTSFSNKTDFESGTTNSFLNNERRDLGMHGFVWNVGLQHDFVLETLENDKETPLRWITIGATAGSRSTMKVTNDYLFVRSRRTAADGTFTAPDTLINYTGSNALKQEMVLPGSYTFGIQYVNATKFRAGVQLGLDQWSQYKNEAVPDTFRNTISVSGGLEYTPDYASYNRFLKRVRYRVGGFYRQDYRDVNGQDINDIGITLGVGLPVTLPRQQTSFVNVALVLGKIGTGTAIEESYARLTVGFTLNDNTWFYKRRFE